MEEITRLSGHDGDDRDRGADERDRVGQERDLAGGQRDHLADRRDQDGDRRDRVADRRDLVADQRDRDADQRDEADARQVSGPGLYADAKLASTREHAHSDRQQSREDRGAAATERTQSEQDRVAASADRVSDAATRSDSEHDRDISLSDRVASQRDRNFGAQFATSLQFGWTVWTLDNPPEFLYVSPGYLKIMGVRPDRADFTLTEALAMIHPDDRAKIPVSYWQPAAGTSVEVEMRITCREGDLRWIRSTSNAVTNVDGTITRAAAEIEDITARKAAEAALRAAQAEAERANLAKTEFVAQMSHELRTPLNAVLGFAQLLELDSLTTSQSEAVGHILRGGRHLVQLIDDALDISRIETNDLEMSTEAILVTDLVAESVGLMQRIATDASIDLHYSRPAGAEHRWVLADRRRLRQVLLNLLSNAVKYNSPGGIVEVTDDIAGELQVRISIRDSGGGIAPHDIPRLFTMFDRLGRKTNDIQGSGIGLAHSRRLVEAMSGRLDVESAVGIGSTFSVILPRAISTFAV